MPHQCTSCGRVFDDGSKEMLSGCPECAGNTFQFHPEGADVDPEPDPHAAPPAPPEPPGSTVARTVGKTAATVRDVVSGGSGDDRSATAGDDRSTPAGGDDIIVAEEDTAQASARTDVVGPDELPGGTADEPTDGFEPTVSVDDGTTSDDDGADPRGDAEAVDPPGPDERPDLAELRAELNQQFESIRVLEPGHYELNLMELYDREEYIIALQEDGRYRIQVPDAIGD